MWAATTAAVAEREAHAARSLQTVLLPGHLLPQTLTYAQRNTALTNGVCTTTSAAGAVHIERMVTTYATNAAGEAAYHDLTTVRTLAYLCASLRGRIATKFARHKLGNDDARGANVITPSSLRAEIIALFGEWMPKAGTVKDLLDKGELVRIPARLTWCCRLMW